MIKISKIWLFVTPVLFVLSGCGSPQEKPFKDNPFDRTMDVADEAVFYDRLQQAALNYEKSFDYALTSDDVLNIDDAGYNLAVVQLGMNNLQKALDTVHKTRNELLIRNQQNSPQLDLVEAAILYRMKNLSQAQTIVQRAENSSEEDIRERSLFLSGLIASDQGNVAQLNLYLQKLDQLLEKSKKKDISSWKADQDELHALLAFHQNQYVLTIASAKTAEDLRRNSVEYSGMVRALVLQAKANEAMQHNIAAAQFYVRAGQTALLLKEYNDAKLYFNRAISLHADHLTYTMASNQLEKLAKEQAKQKE